MGRIMSCCCLHAEEVGLSTSQITHQRPPLTSTSYPSSSSLAAESTHTSSSTSIAHQPVQPFNEQTNQLMAIAEQDIGNVCEKRKSIVSYPTCVLCAGLFSLTQPSHYHNSSSRMRDSSSSSHERTM